MTQRQLDNAKAEMGKKGALVKHDAVAVAEKALGTQKTLGIRKRKRKPRVVTAVVSDSKNKWVAPVTPIAHNTWGKIAREMMARGDYDIKGLFKVIFQRETNVFTVQDILAPLLVGENLKLVTDDLAKWAEARGIMDVQQMAFNCPKAFTQEMLDIMDCEIAQHGGVKVVVTGIGIYKNTPYIATAKIEKACQRKRVKKSKKEKEGGEEEEEEEEEEHANGENGVDE